MATLAELRNSIITSIRGRRMGFDHNDWLMGPKGTRIPVNAATSDTTGTNLINYGINSVVTTTDDTWVLDDPVEGGYVTVRTGSSSTGTHTINPNNATFRSSVSSTSGTLQLVGSGAAVTLYGESTAIWAPIAITKKSTAPATAGGVHITS